MSTAIFNLTTYDSIPGDTFSIKVEPKPVFDDALAVSKDRKSIFDDAISISEDEMAITAAKAAASLMAMTNVYYRFTHLVEDHEFQKCLPN